MIHDSRNLPAVFSMGTSVFVAYTDRSFTLPFVCVKDLLDYYRLLGEGGHDPGPDCNKNCYGVGHGDHTYLV